MLPPAGVSQYTGSAQSTMQTAKDKDQGAGDIHHYRPRASLPPMLQPSLLEHGPAESCNHKAKRAEPARPAFPLQATKHTGLRESAPHNPGKAILTAGTFLLRAAQHLPKQRTAASTNHGFLAPTTIVRSA